MTLSWSRALYLEFFFDQTTENFLRGHVRAFQDWCGAPRIILYDNLRSAVLERRGDQIRFNPRLLELAGRFIGRCFLPEKHDSARGPFAPPIFGTVPKEQINSAVNQFKRVCASPYRQGMRVLNFDDTTRSRL